MDFLYHIIKYKIQPASVFWLQQRSMQIRTLLAGYPAPL